MTILSGLILSITLNFYFINKYNKKDNSVFDKYEHHMLKSDPEKFWREAHNINVEIKEGKNFFETGIEYRIAYLPSKLIYIYSQIFNDKLYENQTEIYFHDPLIIDSDKTNLRKINFDNKKVFYLIFQSLLYFLSILFLSLKVKKLFDSKYSFLLIIFLCFEPNIFLFHSSFWSESVFFSILILCIALIIDKDLNLKKNFILGLLLGLLFLQRSVAIYYFLIIAIFYLIFIQEKKYEKILFVLTGYFLMVFFLGLHNYNRSSVFQIKPTQAMDGFYTYLTPNILSKKEGKSISEIQNELSMETENWVTENDVDLNKESDRIKYYKHLEKKSFVIMKNNIFETIIYTIKKTLHYLVFDPFRHVYYFYEYNLSEQDSFTKTDDHKKNISLRIFYSLVLYSLASIGLFKMIKEKKNSGLVFFLLFSIIYFISVSSWTGNNRYNVPNLIFMSFFIVEGLNYLFSKFFKKNDY